MITIVAVTASLLALVAAVALFASIRKYGADAVGVTLLVIFIGIGAALAVSAIVYDDRTKEGRNELELPEDVCREVRNVRSWVGFVTNSNHSWRVRHPELKLDRDSMGVYHGLVGVDSALYQLEQRCK